MKFSKLEWKASGVLGALLAASLLIPQLLPIIALLFLYLLPGYLIIQLIKPGLGLLEAFTLSILLSIMASTFAIYWLSMLFGYSIATFYIFFIIVSSLALATKGLPHISLREMKKELGKEKAPILLAIATAAALFSILYLSLWVPAQNGVVVGGWNYGDYFLHLSIIQSVNSGNFPPQEPIYSGEPLAYHWFIDFHTAIASRLLSIFPILPSILDSTMGVLILSLLTYSLAFHFTKNRNASLLAAFLLIIAVGFGYLRLADEAGKAPLTTLLRSDAFDNKGDFFQVPSMLPGFLLSQRPMAIGLPAFAAVILLVIAGYPADKRRLFLAGIILGLMPPFQYYAFLAAALTSALYFAYYHASSRSTKGMQNALLVILPSLLLASPFLFSALGRAGGMTRLGLGWLAPKTDAIEFVKFYLANFGLAFLLAFPGYFAFRHKQKPFLALAAALLFIIPNIATFSNTQWDMSKFFMLMMVPTSILAGAAIARLDRLLLPIILLFCILSPLLASVFYITCGWVGLSYQEISAGEWMQENTAQLSTFASSTTHNTPIDSIAGRLRILGYRGWAMNYGLSSDSRYYDLRQIYCGPRGNVPSLMQKYNATYAYISVNEVRDYGCVPSFQGIEGFSRAYAAGSIEIYRFTG